MAFDNTVTIVGNAVNAPELRFSAGGTAVTSFSVAWNKRSKDGEDEAHFFDVTCFGDLAENVAETIVRGARVVVYGNLVQRSWEKDGERRSKLEILADEVAPSLRWATAVVTRTTRRDNGGSRTPATVGASPAVEFDPDEEPF